MMPEDLEHRRLQEELAESIPHKDLYECKNPWKRYIHGKRRDVILGFLDNVKGIVLDLGCGDGFFLEKVHDDAVGIDVSRRRIKRAKQRSTKPVLLGDAERLPFRDRTFDQVIISEVLEHLRDPNDSLIEVTRVMKKTASVIISVPNDRNLKFAGKIAHIFGIVLGGISESMRYEPPTVNDHLHEIRPEHLEKFFSLKKRSTILFDLPFRLAFFHIGLYEVKKAAVGRDHELLIAAHHSSPALDLSVARYSAYLG